MILNQHSRLNGLHAPFSPSQPSWLRYDAEKLKQVYANKQAAKLGTRIHAYAKEAIDLGMRQPKSKKTICAYINDAISFRMKTEVVLFYSEYFFGTADTISFRDNKLRIHDLKTGEHPASMEQLLIYAALFCLEYRIKPGELDGIELRLYQKDEVLIHNPEADEIAPIMDKIITFNKILEKLNKEV